jgi:hypothetical protein
VTAVAAGTYHSLALKSDGTVVGWGAGLTNDPVDYSDNQAAVPAGLSNVVAIAAGAFHSLALKSDGLVVAWGAGSSSSTNDPFGFGQATVPAGLGGVVAIAAGAWNSLALFAPPSLAAPLTLADGSVQVTPSGAAGMSYTVEASSDLLDWSPLASGVATNAIQGFIDADAATLSRRFYRALMP